MADELQFYGDPSSDTGLTVVARVYDEGGSQVGSDVSCSEIGSLAIYQGDMPSASSGLYGVRFFSGATLLGQGDIQWNGSTEVLDFDTTKILDGTLSYDAALRVMLSVLGGKLSGAGTSTEIFRDTGDSKNRVTATVDASGNRTAITLDGS